MTEIAIKAVLGHLSEDRLSSWGSPSSRAFKGDLLSFSLFHTGRMWCWQDSHRGPGHPHGTAQRSFAALTSLPSGSLFIFITLIVTHSYLQRLVSCHLQADYNPAKRSMPHPLGSRQAHALLTTKGGYLLSTSTQVILRTAK